MAYPKVNSISQVTRDQIRKANLVADDSEVYVTELPASDRVIARVTLSGSDQSLSGRSSSGRSSSGGSSSSRSSSSRSLVASPLASAQALDLSADRSRLLVLGRQDNSSATGFWSVPVTGGAPERLGDLTGRDGAWSADGKELVFANGSSIYLANAAGNEQRLVFSASGSVFAPRLSPDGQRIRFTVSNIEQGTTSLWEVRRDGSNAHSLLSTWPYRSTECCGSWTADGRYYIFQATQTVPNTTTIITTLWAFPDSGAGDETTPVALTSGPMSFGNPFPGRDNKNIWAIGVQPWGEVVKYKPRQKKFVPVVPGLSATDLDFSPDGKWITYVAIPGGTLWRSRANGADKLQLTTAPDRAALPRWSPDDKQIAFVSLKPGGSWKISIVAANGGQPEPISADGSQIDANWSADGTRLMFGNSTLDAGGLSVRILDLKTHEVVTVPGSEGVFSPRWSPDGRYIAALAPGNTALLIYDFETQKWSKWLSEPAGAVNYPMWSADSKYLYFDDAVSGVESIRRVKVGESEPEALFEVATFERFPGALGPWSGRAADGSWMFVRDRSTQEVYQLSVELP